MLSRLELGALQQSFLSWVKEIAALSCVDIIAIDGKAARRSFKTKERKNPLHMVSAWSCHHDLVLGQRKVADK